MAKGAADRAERWVTRRLAEHRTEAAGFPDPTPFARFGSGIESVRCSLCRAFRGTHFLVKQVARVRCIQGVALCEDRHSRRLATRGQLLTFTQRLLTKSSTVSVKTAIFPGSSQTM
ncbi:hypothetical protein GCM10018789_57290 [Streptomyces werraensis]|nr:hypothetical protein GCM10018789_57290 [Streptomyces werraensis]